MIKQNKKRILTPYEKNQLLKYGIEPKKLIYTDAPVEYITNHVDFYDSVFLVDENVLIPRIETEELVERVIQEAKLLWELNLGGSKSNKNKAIQIVDVGTGSGAIAISVAKKLKTLEITHQVVGLDISEDALHLARTNLERIEKSFGQKLAVKFAQSDLLKNLKPREQTEGYQKNKVDLIIANLPYIPSSRIKNLDPSVKDFEPHLALDGGPDGLNLVRKLLKQAESELSDDGMILLELDITHTLETMREFEDGWKVEIVESEFGGVNFGVLRLK
jgi:release factor glutamine methyltransferase